MKRYEGQAGWVSPPLQWEYIEVKRGIRYDPAVDKEFSYPWQHGDQQWNRDAEMLNALGADGWECVALRENTYSLHKGWNEAILKRIRNGTA